MFSISASQIEDVGPCIAEQEQHYRKLSFQDEFWLLLKRYELTYDEWCARLTPVKGTNDKTPSGLTLQSIAHPG
jgi:hypothetical protein